MVMPIRLSFDMPGPGGDAASGSNSNHVPSSRPQSDSESEMESMDDDRDERMKIMEDKYEILMGEVSEMKGMLRDIKNKLDMAHSERANFSMEVIKGTALKTELDEEIKRGFGQHPSLSVTADDQVRYIMTKIEETHARKYVPVTIKRKLNSYVLGKMTQYRADIKSKLLQKKCKGMTLRRLRRVLWTRFTPDDEPADVRRQMRHTLVMRALCIRSNAWDEDLDLVDFWAMFVEIRAKAKKLEYINKLEEEDATFLVSLNNT